MSTKNVGYWSVTGLFAVARTASGVADVMGAEPVAQVMSGLGYPAYFAPILGVWKLLGVAAVLAPGFPLLKEWAYAGFFFTLSGAAVSHLLAGDPPGATVPALVLLLLTTGSYLLRPARRRQPMPSEEALMGGRPRTV